MTKLNFSLTQLEYAIAVHKYGHFAKAAEHCLVTQPTLSMQIQKLEEDLGVTLFDRSKKPILITAIGEKLLPQFRQTLDQAKQIHEVIQRQTQSALNGQLTVGVIPTVAPYLIPRLLPVLTALYPSMQIEFQELQTSRILEALESDEIDVGLLATPVKMDSMFEMPLFYEPFSVLCGKQHNFAGQKRIKYSSLSYDDIWLLEEGHCLRHQVMDLCAVKGKKTKGRQFKFESGSLETLKNLVNSYGGYTLLPSLATDHLAENSVLVPFERPIPAREIGLIYRREHYKNNLIEALGESILQSIPADIRKLRQRDLDVLPIS